MNVTTAQVAAICRCNTLRAGQWVDALNAAMAKFGISSKEHVAAWLAQMAHESQYLSKTEEDLGYSAARLMRVWPERFKSISECMPYIYQPERLANLVYGGRYGNGSMISGDGFKYRGRALPMITFRDNYAEIGKRLGLDLVNCPEKLLSMQPAADAGGAFWQWKGLGPLLDEEGFDAVTMRLSGGYLGADDRAGMYQIGLDIL